MWSERKNFNSATLRVLRDPPAMIQGPLTRELWEGDAPFLPVSFSASNGVCVTYWISVQVFIWRKNSASKNSLCSPWDSKWSLQHEHPLILRSWELLHFLHLPRVLHWAGNRVPTFSTENTPIFPPLPLFHWYSDFRPICSCWGCRFLTFGYPSALGTAWGQGSPWSSPGKRWKNKEGRETWLMSSSFSNPSQELSKYFD